MFLLNYFLQLQNILILSDPLSFNLYVSGLNNNVRSYRLCHLSYWQYRLDSGIAKGGANEQLLISFGNLPIVIFMSKFLPIEVLLFQNGLFIFKLDSNSIFILPSESHMHFLLVLSVKNEEKKQKRIASGVFTRIARWKT